MPHTKILGEVREIDGTRWWAMLAYYPHGWAYAEMDEPLPDHAVPGSLFTIHRTKRGDTYLYWITKPRRTQRQLKCARIRARGWATTFGWRR